jgi:hypothetical protein
LHVATQPIGFFAAARNFLGVLWRVTRELFHEVTGALFFVVAVSALSSAWRSWHHGASHLMLGITAGYALLMVLFGVLSFRDSRRVR